MSKPQPCRLSYLVRGITSAKPDRLALVDEVTACLEHADLVTVLPVVDGVQIDIEVTDIKPFREESFEPYVCEHVLKPAVSARGMASAEAPSALDYVEPRLLKKVFN